MSDNLELQKLKLEKLAGEKYLIPHFQRGYRWDIQQVRALLDDIKEYIDNKPDSFLCLQPIVVYEKNKQYVVIDGQQRLTTLALIEYCLPEGNKEYKIAYEKYKDKECTLNGILCEIDKIAEMHEEIPKQIEDEAINEAIRSQTYKIYNKLPQIDLLHSLDVYHIILSCLTIKKWLSENPGYDDKINDLCKSNNDKHSIQFIWYDVSAEINEDKQKAEQKAIDIFTRLNIGKIPLSDAELIKALFLKQDNFGDNELDRKMHIAYKWDEIEKTLNNDSFWYFLSNDDEEKMPKKNRIELVLELAIGIKNGKNHELFTAFENELKVEIKSGEETPHDLQNKKFLKMLELWQKIEECFMTLREWYNDNELYHHIGYLTYCDENTAKLYKDYTNTKEENIGEDDSKKARKKKIKPASPGKDLQELNYNNDGDKNKIKKILLFCDVMIAIESNRVKDPDMPRNEQENSKLDKFLYRYPFDIFIKEKWDVEHISSQTENPLTSLHERVDWFLTTYKYLLSKPGDDSALKDSIDQLIKTKKLENAETGNAINKILTNLGIDSSSNPQDVFKDDTWTSIYEEMLKKAENEHSPLDEEQEHHLGNLVLLSRDINRSYKNALFGVKRRRIVEEDMDGKFIPFMTKRAFLRYYCPDNQYNYWDKTDCESLFKGIEEIVDKFKEETE